MAGAERRQRVWLVRHGQTEWSRDGRHTGRTEVALTLEGEQQALALAPFAGMAGGGPGVDLVLCSPRQRARRTAELAGLVPFEVDDDLQEWDYGQLEGRTTAEIRAEIPAWSIWDGPWSGGETALDVAARADRLLGRIRSAGAERVVLVGHGHFSRVLAARWIGRDASAGRWLDLDTGTWSELGWSRDERVVRRWNVPAG